MQNNSQQCTLAAIRVTRQPNLVFRETRLEDAEGIVRVPK